MLIAQIPETIENRPNKAFILLCNIGSYEVGQQAAAAKPVRIVTSFFQCVVFYDVCNFLELVSHHQGSTLHWTPVCEPYFAPGWAQTNASFLSCDTCLVRLVTS